MWRREGVAAIGAEGTTVLGAKLKGGRVMIAFFVNYSTVAFPLHLSTLKRQQFFGAVAVWRQPVKRWMLAKGE